jgi:cell wall-associated NlpC family hydrolase
VASAHHKAAPKAHSKIATASKKSSEFKSASKPGNDTLVRTALRLRGSRYRFGGVSRRGFDCSGFTRYVYSKYGISLPHSSAAQAHVGRPVSRGELKAGDLVFFATRGRRIGHVGIYIGNNQIVHAATYGRGVRTDSLSSGYYSGRYRCARRVK